MSTIASHSSSASTQTSSPRRISPVEKFHIITTSVAVTIAVGILIWLAGTLLESHPVATLRDESSTSSTSPIQEERRTYELRQQALVKEQEHKAKLSEQQRIAAQQEQERQAKLLDQQRIASEQEAARQAKEARQRMALARIEGLENEASILRRDITATENQQADHQTRVNEYMMDHKMAIAALAAGVAGAGVAFDESNEFSEDAKGLGGATAVIAGLWALANYEEVIEVADRMAKASAMQNDYKNRIDRMKQRVITLNSQVSQEKRNLE